MLHQPAKSLLRSAAAVVLSFGLAAGGVRPQTRASVRLRATLAGHKKNITGLYFSPGGETLATVSQDGVILLWNVGTGETRATLSVKEKYRLTRLLWSPDGLRLAACANRGWSSTAEVRVWDARTGELKISFEPDHKSYMTGFEWSPDGRVLMTANEDGTAKLWDAETGRLRQTLAQEPWGPNETDSVLKSSFTRKKFAEIRYTRAHFDAAGRNVLTLSYNSPPKLWDAADGKLKATVLLTEVKPDATNYFSMRDALMSPDRRLVVRDDDKGVALLDTATGEVRRALGNLGKPLAFSPDGRMLLAAVPGKMLKLYDAETGLLRLTFENIPEGVRDIYWSPDGSHVLAGGSWDNDPRVLDTRNGRVTARLPYGGCTSDSLWGSGGCESYGFSADGRVVFKRKSPLKLWSTETGELLATLEEMPGTAVFSPTDKQLLVTKGKDKRTALLWEVTIK